MRGYDIYVDKDRVSEAREIIAQITGIELYVENDDEEQEQGGVWWTRITHKTLALISVAIMGLSVIACFIAYFISQ